MKPSSYLWFTRSDSLYPSNPCQSPPISVIIPSVTRPFNTNDLELIFDIKSFNKNDCVDKLDPVILSKNILDPILNIKDLRTDHRVDFIDGKLTSKKLEEYVDNGKYSVAFLLKPIKVSEIKEVADKNKIMPPKSTYVEPKLRSGLVIYNIEEWILQKI